MRKLLEFCKIYNLEVNIMSWEPDCMRVEINDGNKYVSNFIRMQDCELANPEFEDVFFDIMVLDKLRLSKEPYLKLKRIWEQRDGRTV